MKLDVDVMSCEDTINSILHFQTDDNSTRIKDLMRNGVSEENI